MFTNNNEFGSPVIYKFISLWFPEKLYAYTLVDNSTNNLGVSAKYAFVVSLKCERWHTSYTCGVSDTTYWSWFGYLMWYKPTHKHL